MTDLSILSLRGGQNDTDAPQALADDECVVATNVEFFNTALGERRNGCGPIDITGSGLEAEAIITHLSQWFPTNDPITPEWIAIGATPNVSATVAARTAGVWGALTLTDPLITTNPDVYGIVTQSLNGKVFVACRTAQDRLHVRDAGTSTLRRAGLAQPAPPTGADEGGGSYATIRYFRVRYVVLNGSTVLRRSEPSTTLSFTPSGAGAGVTITKPATISEGETHWEIEGSENNADFYLVTRLPVGTATYNDETPYATGYAAGVLSEAMGTYLLQPSAKYLAVDGDRLIFGGHWTDATKQSQVGWSEVFADPGAGNDERLPLAVNNTVNLDNYDGGPLTGISTGINGTWYAFKWVGIFKMVRTGDVIRAYDIIPISKTYGAIPGSIVRGMTETGSACIYFLDPFVGPSRLGGGGPQAMTNLRGTWGRVNLQAGSVVARSAYYASKQQIHWWVAVDGSDRPTLKLVLQISLIRSINGVLKGCWSLATGRIAEAAAVGVFTEVVSINGVSSLSDRPVVGLSSPDYLQRCDTESTDAGVSYTATIRTKPYLVAGLLNRWGAMAAALLATATTTASIVVKLIRDLQIETSQVTTALAPTGSETLVVKHLDNLAMSEATLMQIEFTDP